MSEDYPDNAMAVKFHPLSGKLTTYRVWTKHNYYYWYACGNSGKEETLEAAMRAAREYISMGVHGLKSHGEYHGVL